MIRWPGNVAVVGVTGMVGQTFIKVLQERSFPVKDGSFWRRRAPPVKISINGQDYAVEEAGPESFEGIDFAFFSAGGDISLQLAPEAVKRGTVVIDNSSAFRMDPEVPLVVPEVNPEAVQSHKGLLANPNCSTIQMVVALQPLHLAAGLKRVVVATYQSVSGAGREAVDELVAQSRAVLDKKTAMPKERIPYKNAAKQYQIAFNMVPHIDVFDEDDYTKEEMKMIRETRKIMNLPDLPITATTVRVPVFNGHSEAVNVELKNPLSSEDARRLLSEFPGIIVLDNPSELSYPMPVYTEGRDEVFVGRIRTDHSVPYGLNMWVVADNIRKGAVTNSIQIAELLL